MEEIKADDQRVKKKKVIIHNQKMEEIHSQKIGEIQNKKMKEINSQSKDTRNKLSIKRREDNNLRSGNHMQFFHRALCTATLNSNYENKTKQNKTSKQTRNYS